MRRGARDGFTLIEALVAFAIVAAATVVAHRSLVQSRLATARTAERETAEWVAWNLLAEPLSALDMSAGGRTGSLSGHRYDMRLTPLSDPAEGTLEGTPGETLEEKLGERPGQRPGEKPGAAGPGTSPAGHPAEPQVRWLPMLVRISVEMGRPEPLTVETIKLGRVVRTGTAGPSR